MIISNENAQSLGDLLLAQLGGRSLYGCYLRTQTIISRSVFLKGWEHPQNKVYTVGRALIMRFYRLRIVSFPTFDLCMFCNTVCGRPTYTILDFQLSLTTIKCNHQTTHLKPHLSARNNHYAPFPGCGPWLYHRHSFGYERDFSSF